MIKAAGILVGQVLLGRNLRDFAIGLRVNGWSSVDANALGGILEVAQRTCQLKSIVEDLKSMFGWVGNFEGLAYVDGDVNNKEAPLSIVLGDVHHSVYTNGPRYHVNARTFVANGEVSPPTERVPTQRWEELCRMPQFREITVLSLVRDE